MVFSWGITQRKGEKMRGYEHLAEQIYTDWTEEYEGLKDRTDDLASRKMLILRIDLLTRILEEEMEAPSFFPVELGFSFLDVSDCKNGRTENGKRIEKLGGIANSGFADDWFNSMRGLYILLETIIAKFDDEISFE